MNVSIIGILSHTPFWVFALFAYLVWTGIKRLRPRVRELARIWITPGIFIAWGLLGLWQRPGEFANVLTPWAIGAVLGGALGLAGSMRLQVDRERRLVLLPASVLPLLRIVLIFGSHYALNIAAALHPQMRADYMHWDIYVSGASAGYFIGWSLRFMRSYATAAHADLGAVPG